jgi:hypothetical protein
MWQQWPIFQKRKSNDLKRGPLNQQLPVSHLWEAEQGLGWADGLIVYTVWVLLRSLSL